MRTDEILKKLTEAQGRSEHADLTAQKADGEGKTADSLIAKAEGKEAQADVDLYNLLLREATLAAPFDGIILSGDIDQRQESRVQTGQVLFEVAPQEKPRAELAVAERDIQELQVGQLVRLATNSYAGQEFLAHVERIVPEGVVHDGENTFKVLAVLDQQADWMRPGMAGEARVDTTRRSLAWIWTHRLIDFLRPQTLVVTWRHAKPPHVFRVVVSGDGSQGPPALIGPACPPALPR